MMVAQVIAPEWSFAELVSGICDLADPPAALVSGLSLDSRRVEKGHLFFACAGGQVHGKRFIDDAIDHGADVVMWEASETQRELRRGVPVIGVPGLREIIGPIAERFYGSPTEEQFVVGVTGTNGKTSISQFVAQAFQVEGPCAVIGTLGNGLFGKLRAGTHTTPDAISLHALLDEMRIAEVSRVVMEVSSHGLEQGRTAGVAFDVAVFSNLSHEHLDYHGDMESYARAKQRLFQLEGLKAAVINADDEFGQKLLRELPAGVKAISYGFGRGIEKPDLLGSDLQLDLKGLRMRVQSAWGDGELCAPVLGAFNAENLLAALGVLLASDINFEQALLRLSQVKPVPGRMENYGGGKQPLVVVDYAHTPNALEQVLLALREHTQGKLWCVFGCGGDRDKSKRPLMVAKAASLAEQIIVTDDNPRSEGSAQIISDIMQGCENVSHVKVVADRASAIVEAIHKAALGDIVLVAGKGHEDYQLIGDQRLPFSDAVEVKKALLGWKGDC